MGVDPEPFAAFATKTLRRPLTATDLTPSFLRDPALQKALLKEFDRIASRKKLQGFERIKGVHIGLEPFTVENDLLTPTLKLKRSDAAKAFRTEINKMYDDINAKAGQVIAKL